MQNDWAEEHFYTIFSTYGACRPFTEGACASDVFNRWNRNFIFNMWTSFESREPNLVCNLVVKAAGLVAFLLTLFITRRQALKDKEPFWSNWTRQVIYSLIPLLFAGISTGIACSNKCVNSKPAIFTRILDNVLRDCVVFCWIFMAV